MILQFDYIAFETLLGYPYSPPDIKTWFKRRGKILAIHCKLSKCPISMNKKNPPFPSHVPIRKIAQI
jgi:hypothetical protein